MAPVGDANSALGLDDSSAAESPSTSWFEVVGSHPRVAVRAAPSISATILGVKRRGELVEALTWDETRSWVQVFHESAQTNGWMAVELPNHGKLLQPVDNVHASESRLMRAIRLGMHTEVEKLVSCMLADPNERDEFGETPLFEAATVGQLQCTAVLLWSRADPNAVSSSNTTAIEFAADEQVKALLTAYAGRPVFDEELLNAAVESLPELWASRTRLRLGEIGRASYEEESKAAAAELRNAVLAASELDAGHGEADAELEEVSAAAAPQSRRAGAFSASRRAGAFSTSLTPTSDEPRPSAGAELLQAARADGLPLYEVVHKPRVAVRAHAGFDAEVVGVKRTGTIVQAVGLERCAGGTWIQVQHVIEGKVGEGWMALRDEAQNVLVRLALPGAEPSPLALM